MEPLYLASSQKILGSNFPSLTNGKKNHSGKISYISGNGTFYPQD